MPVLPNARHERFAQELAKGCTIAECLAAAGAEPVALELASKCYVYALVDGATSRAFYVGKGTGLRAAKHLQDAYSDNPVNAQKASRIVAANERGEYQVVVLFDGMTSAAALKLERKLIGAGRAWLTNATSGTRTQKQRAQDQVLLGLSQIMPLCVVLKRKPHAAQAWAGLIEELGATYALCSEAEAA